MKKKSQLKVANLGNGVESIKVHVQAAEEGQGEITCFS